MVGIVSYGAYIPYYRISRNVIQSAIGWLSSAPLPGEKAVANFDEDAITMAVAAGIDCLKGMAWGKIDGLYFATTTQPYILRQNAGVIATALDLCPDIRTADFTDSTKSGTGALLSAWDSIKAGAVDNILICASDCRLSKAGSAGGYLYGDAAVAFLVGKDEVIASLEGSYSISYDFTDRRRVQGEKFEHSWEDRWIRDAGYTKFIPEAILKLLKKYGLNIKDFTRVIYSCPYIREHAAIGKGLGIEPSQIQEPMLATVGDAGTAHPLMMLVAALEEAKPGDKFLVVSFGNGCDALFLY